MNDENHQSGPFRPEPRDPSVLRHATLYCRGCGRAQDSVGVDGDSLITEPVDGDFAICLWCATVSLYVIGPLGVTQRAPTAAELVEFSRDPDASAMLDKVRRFRATKRQ